MTETLHIAALDFEVRRSSRRKTLGLTVDRAGELVVHAPESMRLTHYQKRGRLTIFYEEHNRG